MESEDGLHDISDLPISGPGVTLAAAATLYQKANQLLTSLGQQLQQAYDGQENSWLSRVEAVRPKETGKQHFIAIIGATGAGKSSLINALLDIARLVPTSCMQACTATIIEIAYNWCTVHEYRCTVEFISREKWRSELDTFFKYFVNAPEEDLKEETSAAAIAYAKVTAVYPDLSRDALSKCTPAELLARPNLDILGTERTMNASTSDDLHEQLQKYVESKEKSKAPIGASQEDTPHCENAMEYWPLVDTVRVYTKAAVLETGCVLVDLPGNFDVNAARAATAKAYLARCASVWIVAPIKRAVDDKLAQSLLNEGLKYQLRRDGALGRVVMICSNADQSNVDELKGKKNIRADVTLQAALDENDSSKKELARAKKDASNFIEENEKLVEDTSEKVANLQAEHDAYGKLLQMANDGQAVHPPVLQKAKRGIATRVAAPRKQARLGNMTSANLSQLVLSIGNDRARPDHAANVNGREHGANSIKQDHTQPPLNATEIQSRMDTIQKSLGKLRTDLATYNEKLRAANLHLEELQAWDSIVIDNEWIAYYHARNKQVVKSLQADFRSGIEGLEKIEIEAGDDLGYSIDAEKIKDAQTDLQVFCVASRDFQRLRGRFEEEQLSGRFRQLEETGIPELMQVCINIGESHLRGRRKIFAGDVHQLLNSVLWLLPSQKANRDEVRIVLPKGSLTIEDLTEELLKDLGDCFRRLTIGIDNQFNRVTDVLTKAARRGERKALETVQAWNTSGDPITHAIHPSTYRAIVRHRGTYTNKIRSYNWTEELLGPMMRILDVYWIRAFKKAIPANLQDALRECSILVDQYLTKLQAQWEFFCAPEQDRAMFKQQFESSKITLHAALNATGQTIDERIKIANRVCGDAVSSRLTPLFDELAADQGPGVVRRNKQALEKGMDRMKKELFTGAAEQVKSALATCQRDYQNTMWTTLEETIDARRHDCQRLFGKELQQLEGMSTDHESDILEIVRDIAALLNIEIVVNEPDRDDSFEDREDSVHPNDKSVKEEIFTQPAIMVQADFPEASLPDLSLELVLVEEQPSAPGDLRERPELQEA